MIWKQDICSIGSIQNNWELISCFETRQKFSTLSVREFKHFDRWFGYHYWGGSNLGIYRIWHMKLLTHWGRDQMATIFQTTFSNAFSLMKMYKFRLRFHWSLFPRFQLTLPERTRGRPWGRLRVRIRSIEKTWGWKFYPAAQNFTNRMLFRNTHIFKTI